MNNSMTSGASDHTYFMEVAQDKNVSIEAQHPWQPKWILNTISMR